MITYMGDGMAPEGADGATAPVDESTESASQQAQPATQLAAASAQSDEEQLPVAESQPGTVTLLHSSPTALGPTQAAGGQPLLLPPQPLTPAAEHPAGNSKFLPPVADSRLQEGELLKASGALSPSCPNCGCSDPQSGPESPSDRSKACHACFIHLKKLRKLPTVADGAPIAEAPALPPVPHDGNLPPVGSAGSGSLCAPAMYPSVVA